MNIPHRGRIEVNGDLSDGSSGVKNGVVFDSTFVDNRLFIDWDITVDLVFFFYFNYYYYHYHYYFSFYSISISHHFFTLKIELTRNQLYGSFRWWFFLPVVSFPFPPSLPYPLFLTLSPLFPFLGKMLLCK